MSKQHLVDIQFMDLDPRRSQHSQPKLLWRHSFSIKIDQEMPPTIME
jgi:hypothetical protein